MKISYNWLKEFVDINVSVAELDNTMTMLGLEVESVEYLGKKYDKFIIGYVESKDKHPDADKLSVCQVNTGSEVLQVICGAPNVDQGQKIVLGLSGAVVPNGGFELGKRKIRGIESNGMICSKAELDLGEDHSGIWVLDSDNQDESIIVGTELATYLNMNDIILEIGITPNKAECLSHYGIARELAAYYGLELKHPTTIWDELIKDANNIISSKTINDYLSVNIENTEDCPRYFGTMVVETKAIDSPDWVKQRLNSLGIRPINAIVDVTNLILLEVGQPLHSFDYDEIKSKQIVVKSGFDGLKYKTLDSKERTLTSEMLMICDGEEPAGIAGVMGGENSEIKDTTTNVFIESAFFNPASIRKTSKTLSLQTDASYRFERGTDINIVEYAGKKAAEMIVKFGGGKLVSGFIDAYPNPKENLKIELKYSNVKRILGVDIAADFILPKLNTLGLVSSKISDENNGVYEVDVPQYRHDISSEIDIIEDIARVYNYDNIESNLNSNINFGSSRVPENLSLSNFRFKVRDFLISNGYNQIYTQNMTDPKTANLVGGKSIEILNPLGEDLSLLRRTMMTSMLKTISFNIRQGNSDVKLFEIGKTFNLKDEQKDIDLKNIVENLKLSIGMAGNIYPKNWIENRKFDFYDIKGLFMDMVSQFSIDKVDLKPNTSNPLLAANSLEIWLRGKVIGHFGIISKKTMKFYDLDDEVLVLEIDLKVMEQAAITKKSYTPASQYPSIQRDLAFMIDKDVNYDKIRSLVIKNGTKLLKSVDVFDVYAGKNIEEGKKSIAFNMMFNSEERTLQESEIESVINNVIKTMEKDFKATLRNF